MKKRVLSLALAVLMLFSLMPMSAFADDSVTRVEWIQKLIVTFEMEVAADNYPDNYYSDISSDDEFYRDIMVATEFGLIDTEPGTAFEPNAAVTREFAAHTLNHCLGFQLEDAAAYTFADSAELEYADDAQVAVDRGWFKLVDGKFSPDTLMTLAESEAMLADAKAILAGEAISSGHSDVFTYAEGVIEIPRSAGAKLLADGRLALPGYTGSLKADDIIAVYIGVFPTIYKVGAVSADAVAVTELSGDDYIVSIDAEGSVNADLADTEAAEDASITYIFEDGTETQDQKLAKESSMKIKDVNLSKTINLGEGIKLVISGSLSSLKFSYKLDIGLTHQEAMAKLEGDAKFGCSLSADMLKMVSVPSSYTICYVPIYGVGKFSVNAVFSLNGEISVQYTTSFTAGFEYDNGFRMLHSFKAGSFTLNAQINAKAGIKAELGLADIPFVSGNIFFEIGGKSKMSETIRAGMKPEDCEDVSSHLYAEAGAKASIKYVKTWSKTYTIWDLSNSPKKSHSHWEDGLPVSKCAYEDGCIKDGYGKNGYTTPANSKYYNNGGSSQSSKGYNSASEPYTIYTYTLDDYKNATITSYKGNVSALTLPKKLDGYTVTAVGADAFEGNLNLRYLTIPEGITSIGYYAFRGCINLASISFPESLVTIGRSAFYGCNSLTEVVLPSKLQTISDQSFANCANLQSVFIPASIKDVDTGYVGKYGPFYGCEKLTKVSFAEGITAIPTILFQGCTGLKSITIPDTVTTIGGYAFADAANLESVKLGNSVTAINASAFENCKSLKDINLPSSLNSIGYYAFKGCTNLASISFPESLVTIGRSSFYGCNSLTEVVLPSKLQTISDQSFAYCANLQSVFIPASIKNVDTGYVGRYGPFYGCEKLTKVSFAEGMTIIPYILFQGCTGLKSITIPDTVTMIGGYAFADAANLESVKLGNSVTAINVSAFANCKSLKDINLPASLTTIENSAFSGCASLENIVLPEKVESIKYNTFCDCTSLKSIKLPEALKTIGDSAFSSCTALESINVPDKVTAIGENAFYQCAALKEVKLGASMQTIGNNAFNNCDALTDIKFPEGLTRIGNSAFYDSDALVDIVIPNSVTHLGEKCFAYCESLKNVTLGNGLTVIPYQAFFQCPALETIMIPAGVTEIAAEAFKNSTALVSATIPKSVTSIGDQAFSYNDRLTIYGVSGTAAETYANSLGCKFVAISKAAESVTVSKTELRIANGSTAQLTASVSPVDFTDNYAWKSSNTDVVMVEDRGVIRAVGVGEATVSFIAGNVKGSCTVTVYQGATVIGVSQKRVTLDPGDTFTLIATVLPNNVENKAHTWSSSDESIAKVSSDGVITAVAPGTAEIIATSDDNNSLTASCTVTVSDVTLAASVDELQSEHPYAPDCEKTWKYTKPGAAKLNVTFSAETSVEEGSDYIYIYTGNGTEVGKYTGTELAGKTIEVEGDTVKIKLVSDNVMCEYGFAVTDVSEYQAPHTHAYSDKVTAPTCTEKGYTTHTCACGDSYKDTYVDALGHDTELKNAKAATETENGYTGDEVCKVCGTTVKTGTVIPATGASHTHAYSDKVTAPTCTEQGYTTHTCSCGESYKDTYVNALGHDYKDGVCTRCGAKDPDYKEPTPAVSFTDVADKAYYAAPVAWAVEKGITGGYPDNTFKPMNTCTRAQIVTFIWRAMGSPEPAGTGAGFTDVPKDMYYYKAVLWASENGITSGFDDGGFHPDELVTRAQAMTFLWRAEGKPAVPAGTENTFVDVPETAYYHDAVLWAVANGVTGGYDSQHFGSMDGCTRAQIVTFLYRDMAK